MSSLKSATGSVAGGGQIRRQSDELSPNLSPSITPNGLANQVPKYGTVIPNRIFVGGIATNTTDQELKVFFSSYGAVKDTKIICDRAGVSKGYGFVTFETQEDAEKIIKKDSENLIFKDRKLNIGPAVRKQQAFPRLIEGLPAVTGATTMFINPYTYATAGGLAAMMPTDTSYQQFQQVQPQIATAAAYSNLIPAQMQAVYMQQPTQYQYATSPAAVQSPPVQYARCYQPTAATVGTNPYSMQPDMIYTPSANHSHALEQLSDGTLQEQAAQATAETAVVTSTGTYQSHLDNCQAITSLMSSVHARAMHQSQYAANPTSTSPQPPPVKKMSPLPTHMPPSAAGLQYASQRCFSAPMVVKPGTAVSPKPLMQGNPCTAQQRIPGLTMAYVTPGHKLDEMRVKFEHDGHLAASIAPPTPPSTPASAAGH